MSLSEDEEFEMAKEEIQRRMMEEAMSDLQLPHFLTSDPKIDQVFYEPKIDENGNVQVDELGRTILEIPEENRILYKTMLLLNSHLVRTCNMTPKEAELALAEIDRFFLMLEAEQDEDAYESKMWALYEAIKIHLESAIRDQINAHRGKLLTVKEWYAHISSGAKKKGGLFRR